MRPLFVLPLAMLGSTLFVTASHADLTLVQEGKPASVIVVAPDATPTVKEAARDLSDYLRKASGATLKIVPPAQADKLPATVARVYIGPSAAAEAAGVKAGSLLPEQYRVKADSNRLIIVGDDLPQNMSHPSVSIVNRSPGTIWGVNYVLDRYVGVRWLWPGEVGTYVPQKKTITVPDLDVTLQPRAEQRQLPMRWKERDAAAEAKAGPEAYQYLITPQEQDVLVRESQRWQERHQMGQRTGFNPDHAYKDWWDRYGQSHPEYFAVPPRGITQPGARPEFVKLRVGNPAVATQIVQDWKAKKSPKIWQVGPNDGSGHDTSNDSRRWDLSRRASDMDIWKGKADMTPRYVRFWKHGAKGPSGANHCWYRDRCRHWVRPAKSPSRTANRCEQRTGKNTVKIYFPKF